MNEQLSFENFGYFYETPENHEKTDINEYEIFLFKNRFGYFDEYFFSFSDEDKSNKFGWIFPIKIFQDKNIITDVQQQENPNQGSYDFFRKGIIYPAFLLLLDNSSSKWRKQQYDTEQYISQLFDEECYVLIVKKTEFKKHISKIENILPSLYKLGFCLIEKYDDFKNIYQIDDNDFGQIKKKSFSNIELKLLSSELRNEAFITSLFTQTLKREMHAIMRFYLVYQIVELLINKIGIELLINKIDITFFENIKNSLNNKSISFYDANEEIKKITEKKTSEKDRIQILFEGKSLNNHRELETRCFLEMPNNPDKTIGDIIYFVRNKIVHGYYNLSQNNNNIEEQLSNFNTAFEDLMVDILVDYKK